MCADDKAARIQSGASGKKTEWHERSLARNFAADMFRGQPRVFEPSVPAIYAQHESARFSVPAAAGRNSDGLKVDAVKNIVDAQRRAPMSIDLISGAEIDHGEGALNVRG